MYTGMIQHLFWCKSWPFLLFFFSFFFTNPKQIRRRAFKELLAHLVPLMLDCLKSPAGTRPAGEDASIAAENASRGFARGSGRAFDGEGLGSGGVGGEGGGAGTGAGGKDLGGEVVVLHYYQQHHQYLLKVAVLETMNRFVPIKKRDGCTYHTCVRIIRML